VGARAGRRPTTKVPPGEHDEYYGFWSGGQSGEIRVVGIPSMRELMRIPVFNKEASRGYGFDDETRGDAGGRRRLHRGGDNHHPVLSETDGDYDGEYLWVNDKANGRIARVSLKYFETDAITDVPNVQSVHGCAVQSPDTGYIFGNGEFRVPLPNDGRDVHSPENYASLFSAVNPETMETEWQVRVDGNLDIVDTDKDGRWAIASAYNSEEATEASGMTHDDRDFVKAFDVPRIEKAVEAGEYEEVNGVPVVDGTKDSPLNSGGSPIVRYIPTPKSPHCVEVGPNGKYAFIAGKLSPTVTMLDIEALDSSSDPDDVVAGRPKVGLGPLHTTFDGNGHAYTSLFIDSQAVKWDIEAAVDADAGSTDPVMEKVDVHYNPGHIQAVEAMTTDPDGEWLVSLNKLSKDRFLPVGPIHPDNDQLIHIGQGETEMEVVADHPAYPEPPRLRVRPPGQTRPRDDVRQGRLRGREAVRQAVRLGHRAHGRALRRREDVLDAVGVRPQGVHGDGGRRGHVHRHEHRGCARHHPRRRHPRVRHPPRHRAPGHPGGRSPRTSPACTGSTARTSAARSTWRCARG